MVEIVSIRPPWQENVSILWCRGSCCDQYYANISGTTQSGECGVSIHEEILKDRHIHTPPPPPPRPTRRLTLVKSTYCTCESQLYEPTCLLWRSPRRPELQGTFLAFSLSRPWQIGEGIGVSVHSDASRYTQGHAYPSDAHSMSIPRDVVLTIYEVLSCRYISTGGEVVISPHFTLVFLSYRVSLPRVATVTRPVVQAQWTEHFAIRRETRAHNPPPSLVFVTLELFCGIASIIFDA